MLISKWTGIALAIGISTGLAVSQVSMRTRHAEKDAPSTGEQRNVKTILTIFRAIEQRDNTRTAELLQPDFEIHWPLSLPYGGTFRGLERRPGGWSATWEPLQPTAAEKTMDARVIAAHNDDVVVLWHQRGLSPKGTRFDGEVLGHYTFRSGKLARAQMFYFDTASVAKFLAEAQQ